MLQWLIRIIDIPLVWQTGLFLLLFFTGWSLENYFSPKSGKLKWKHALFNTKFFIVDVIPQILIGLLFFKMMQLSGKHQFGLVYLLSFEHKPILLFIVSFATLDLGEYIYHVTMHKIKRLWMIHAIHHSDQQVDVSSVLREHPLETIVRNLFGLLWVFLSGVTPWVFLVHLIVQKFFVLFSHTHIWLPEPTNKILSILFITPNIHQVHHHFKQPYTDRNFGDILSIWDRAFGTLRLLPKEEIIFGIDYLMEEDKYPLVRTLLKYPFIGGKK